MSGKKRFTRQWNLARHLKDIHNISDDGEHDIVKQKYDHPNYSNPSPIKNEQIRNSENKMSEMNYNLHPPKYHNFTNRFSSDGYYYNSYENFELFPVDKKKPKLTLQDRIRIQKCLGDLKNILLRYLPNHAVIGMIRWLNYQCCTQHSDQPLKDFCRKNNLWYF
ncbi:MAG: hypothetical protein ACR2F1_12140 [Nitrososphaeraceae archaeon]